MNRPRWILFTAAILLAGCLISLDAYRHYHDAGGRTRDALLSAMPSDASAVLFADLKELRRSPFSAQLYHWIPKSQADAEYTQFLRATGFDYERDLDRVAIAVIKDKNESQLFAIAGGRFDRQKIEAYASPSGARETHGGKEIFSVMLNENARKISFAFLSKDEMALTNSPELATLLAPSRNSADARDWHERFARVAGSPVFAILRQDAAAGSALASQTPGEFQSPQLSALINQLQWISLAAKPEEGALRLVAEGECANEQTSRQLSDLLSGMLVLASAGLNGPQTRRQLDPQVRDGYLEMIKSADVSRLDRGETKSVRLVFDVTSKFLSAVSTAVPAAPNPKAPALPASKTPAPKARSKKPVRN
jgi:hypothetical protein